MEELLKELEAELEASKQLKYGYDELSGVYKDGQDAMLEQIIDRIKDKLKTA